MLFEIVFQWRHGEAGRAFSCDLMLFEIVFQYSQDGYADFHVVI